MSELLPLASREPASRILVVDDDHRVVELLSLALAGHGYQVITASNGDDAVQQAITHRPDLIVLDVRLPRRSGLEVCDLIRRDPDISGTPIVMVSAAGETDARVQGFARGADDYLMKPFSPKELVARIQRLLVRSRDQRDARRRLRELERDMQRAHDDARRAHLDVRREQRLRELHAGPGRELMRALDLDDAGQRLVDSARLRLGSGLAVLFVPDDALQQFVPLAVSGESFARVAGVRLTLHGDLVTLLGGLGRPVLRRDLERFPELDPERPALVQIGAALMAPLIGPEGFEGLLIADDRQHGGPFEPAELELLGALCETGALALHNARRVRTQTEHALALLTHRAALDLPSDLLNELRVLAACAARAGSLDPRARLVLAYAAALGHWGMSPQGVLELDTLERGDLSGIAHGVRMALARAERLPEREVDGDPQFERIAALTRTLIEWVAERASGADHDTALVTALAVLPDALDSSIERALREAVAQMRRAQESGIAA